MEDITSKQLLGFVVIGRNEGDRLKIGLNAIQALCPDSPVVYVDSGSTDDSLPFAQSIGIDTVELDMSIPFTAARGRNAGFDKLLNSNSKIDYVQFLDGDCELLPGWVESAIKTLLNNPQIGIVSGRRSERYPQASIYNQLIDIEWNTQPGEILAVLGDMCVKVETFRAIEGFNEQLIAAEDDDFCLRARRAGYITFRLDCNMTKHDANMLSLSQWYQRSKRGGHGYANIHHIHGRGPEKYFKKEIKSVLFWGAIIPFSTLFFLFLSPAISLLLALGHCTFISKTIFRRYRKGDSIKVACAYGLLIFSGKFFEFLGIFQYCKNSLLSRKHQLIEYK